MQKKYVITWFFVSLLFVVFNNINLFSQLPDSRIALVIGNSDYKFYPVATAIQDATDIGTALREMDFKVIPGFNLKLNEIKELLSNLTQKSEGSTVIVFYYAGHGIQLNGENYLIPIDAVPKSIEEIPRVTISLREVFASLKGQGAKFVILDACRNNPFKSPSGSLPIGEEDWIPGLAPPSGAPVNTLIAYATDPGKQAGDPPLTFTHSYYTWALLQNIQEPGLEVHEFFSRVREIVRTSTQRYQTPWENVSLLTNQFYFRKPATLRFSIPNADDLVVCFINGEEVLSAQLDEPIPSGMISLKSGENKLMIKVFNQKTYKNQNPFLEREGWHYKVIISSADNPDPLKIFEGKEDSPPESHWGRFFTVLTTTISVDPKSGKITFH